MQVKRVLANPAVLVGGVAILVVAALFWRRGGSSRPVAAPAYGTQPGVAGASFSTDQMALSNSDLQQAISSLTQAVSAGFSGGSGAPPPSVSKGTPGCIAVAAQVGGQGGIICPGGTPPVLNPFTFSQTWANVDAVPVRRRWLS